MTPKITPGKNPPVTQQDQLKKAIILSTPILKQSKGDTNSSTLNKPKQVANYNVISKPKYGTPRTKGPIKAVHK